MSGANKPDLRALLGGLSAHVAEVIRRGDEKHGVDTWRALPLAEFDKASLRHLRAMNQGEHTDPEGMPHEAHLVVNALYRYESRVSMHRPRRLPLESSLRLQDTKRWHIAQTGGVIQSVADHTYGVQVIGRELLEEMGRRDATPEYLVLALGHDEDEALYGDMPSPTKPGRYEGLDFLGSVLKQADLLEAWRFISFYGAGPYADRCIEEIYARIELMAQDYPYLAEATRTVVDAIQANPASARDLEQERKA